MSLGKHSFKKPLLLIGGVFAVCILSFGIYRLYQEKDISLTLSQSLDHTDKAGEFVRDSLTSRNVLPFEKAEADKEAKTTEGLIVKDTLKKGVQIQFASQEETLKSEDAPKPEERSVRFPKDYTQPIEVKLTDDKVITILDQNAKYDYEQSALTGDAPNVSNVSDQAGNDVADQPQTAPADTYLTYTSPDQRKTLYYAYQSDQALNEKQLKNWVVYKQGSGQEYEAYTFQNAKLKRNEDGSVGVFYFGDQEMKNRQAASEVDSNLLERAQRVVAQDMQQDILNSDQAPDITIPKPYFIDKDGTRIELDWEIESDTNTLKLHIQAKPEQYPLALDPTLSFTAPATSTTGSVVTGETTSNLFGISMISGDFNADGKTDLAVGASGYSTNTGRVYIFYNDGSYPSTAATADVIITGETTSNSFGISMISGDFNADGKIDLAVGASGYSSSTGRTYIFYNDGSIPTTAATADVIVTGETTSNQFGFSLTSGDFNADGKTDLAVGAAGYSSQTGRAYIFYNDGSYAATADLADVIITGETTSNLFGISMISGDFNADGKTDLAVGARTYSSSTGRVYIFYNDGSIPTTAATADVIITGETTSNQFGFSLTSGDFNADGKTDLAVGAKGYSTSTGRAYIFYNDGSGFGTAACTTDCLAANADVIITGETTSNQLGYFMTSGDFNADGKTDLVIGANLYSSNTGRAYIFYNDGSIPTTAATADVIITGETTTNYLGVSMTSGDFNADGKTDLAVGANAYSTNTGRVYIFYSQNGQVNTNQSTTGETASDSFGVSMTSGDFNADGKTDLAVGASGYSTSTGRAYIFYNDGSIPTTAATADVIITGETASDSFGVSLTSGDFNADGKTDLVVGAKGYSSNTGRAYIFNNDGSIPTTAATADVTITGETGTYFGHALASGDFNADGKTDLAVGAIYYSSSTGRAYIFNNDGSIPTTAATADVTITGGATGDEFGYSMTSGDFNADGKTDLAVASDIYSTYIGRVYIFNNDGSIPTTAATADVTITGETSTNYFGHALASGDFNADGKTDLVVGARAYNGWDGRVYIFNNDGSIPTAAGSADTIITGAAGISFGYALASGDFNADGKTDLAVGSDGYSAATWSTYIFYNDGSIPTTSATADVTISGGSTGNSFGTALAAGDFNADGKTDLAVGAKAYSSDTGQIYVYETRDNYAWKLQEIQKPQTMRTDTTGGTGQEMRITGEATSSQLGTSLVSGDFNADGKTDLAVGANTYSTNTGRAYIFYNDGSIPTTAATADVIITGETAGDSFAGKLASGDFNGDGKTDLAMSAAGYSSQTGRAYIFYNDGSIPTTAATADVIITGEATSNLFGVSLTSGDFNADGKTDLAVSARSYSSSTGRVYIFYNDGSSFGTVACTTDCLAANADVIITGETTSNRFGFSLTSGDFNADGKTDLAVGASIYSSSTGRAYIFYSDGSSFGTVACTTDCLAANADVIITGEATSNQLGYFMTSGDFNADGKTDLVIGANLYSSNTGRAYIFYSDGSSFGTVACTTDCLAANADVIITGETTSNYFGLSLTPGDFNADGKTDLAVGAYGYSTNTGRAYIFYNDGSIPTTAATADVIITGEATSNFFGASLAPGDFNADGKTDLAVGAYGYSSSTGRVYVYTFNDTRITGEATSDSFGSVVSGDFNADGKTDLAVGAFGYSSSTGRVYIFYNDGSLPTTAASADVIVTGENAGDKFGGNMTSGDFNADGKTDLAVGAFQYSSSTGRAYIFYNDGSIPTTAATADVIITGEATSDRFGWSMISGDFNADGKTDLAVSAYFYSSQAGRAYIFYNDGSIPTTAATADVIITGEASSQFSVRMTSGDFNADGRMDLAIGAQSYSSNTGRAYIFYNDGSYAATADLADVIITGETTNNNFGTRLVSGDFNADGKIDLAVSANGYSSNTGRAYIFYNDGSSFGTVACTADCLAANADVVITGETTSNQFGQAFASDDFNADGRTDLAVGATIYSSSTGRAYIFYNDGSIPTTAATADVTITGETTNNSFGGNMTSGDFNADGKTDLAVGANGYSSSTGRVYVYISEAKAINEASNTLRGPLKFRGPVKLH